MNSDLENHLSTIQFIKIHFFRSSFQASGSHGVELEGQVGQTVS